MKNYLNEVSKILPALVIGGNLRLIAVQCPIHINQERVSKGKPGFILQVTNE
jgi:hypothetical protein